MGFTYFMEDKKKWDYSSLLKHPKWQKKRLQILERDNFTCQYCADDQTELQIHHLKYHKNPWDAKNEDLLTLCKDCHHMVTFNKDFEVLEVIKVIYSNETMIFYMKIIYEGKLFIEMLEKFNIEYKSLVRFKHNSIGINSLIILNNG